MLPIRRKLVRSEIYPNRVHKRSKYQLEQSEKLNRIKKHIVNTSRVACDTCIRVHELQKNLDVQILTIKTDLTKIKQLIQESSNRQSVDTVEQPPMPCTSNSTSTDDKRLNLEILDNMVDDLIDNHLLNGGWFTEILVENLPLAFNREALRYSLKEANKETIKTLDKAIGMAYIRNHNTVEQSDCKAAIYLAKTSNDEQDQ